MSARFSSQFCPGSELSLPPSYRTIQQQHHQNNNRQSQSHTTNNNSNNNNNSDTIERIIDQTQTQRISIISDSTTPNATTIINDLLNVDEQLNKIIKNSLTQLDELILNDESCGDGDGVMNLNGSSIEDFQNSNGHTKSKKSSKDDVEGSDICVKQSIDENGNQDSSESDSSNCTNDLVTIVTISGCTDTDNNNEEEQTNEMEILAHL